jgi:hypothetical protein
MSPMILAMALQSAALSSAFSFFAYTVMSNTI